VGVPLASATDLGQALRLLAQRPLALAVVDLGGDRVTLAAIRTLRARHPNVSVAAVVDPANPLLAGEAVHAGALDLIPWPFEDRDILTVLANARDLIVAEPDERGTLAANVDERLVAQSPAMRAVAERVEAMASGRNSLFVCGEAGTGRTVVARVIHRAGSAAAGRADAPFVTADCGGKSPDEIEETLFGAGSEGKKTNGRSAAFDRISRSAAFYRARGGTLFLTNLLDAPARIQARLLRLLRDREAELMEQAGTLVELDVRLVASVDPSVDEAARDGRMRPDLYERLAHMRIDVPPLRRRREDIPVLAVQFLRQLSVEHGMPLKGISRSALKLLTALPWSNNGSELRTLIETLVRSVERPVIQLDDLLERANFGEAVRMAPGVSLRDAKARFERECISAVLARHQGRVGDAAKALGIQRTNLYRKVRQLQVNRPRISRRSSG
jgi:two-component system nitrogen regulation response regulator NtrX